jgi:hypothetical protein
MSRSFSRGFLLHIRAKAAKASALSSELDIFQVQTGAYSSILVQCGGEGTLCVLVQNDWSCKLVKLAVTCVATFILGQRVSKPWNQQETDYFHILYVMDLWNAINMIWYDMIWYEQMWQAWLTSCFLLLSWLAYSLASNIQAVCSSEMLMDFCSTAQLYIPESTTLLYSHSWPYILHWFDISQLFYHFLLSDKHFIQTM